MSTSIHAAHLAVVEILQLIDLRHQSLVQLSLVFRVLVIDYLLLPSGLWRIKVVCVNAVGDCVLSETKRHIVQNAVVKMSAQLK